MKKLLSMVLLCCAMTAYSQQGNKPIDKLMSKMISEFEKYDTGRTIYGNLLYAVGGAFDVPTNPFVDTWKDYEQKYPSLSNSRLMQKITDTVLNHLYFTYLWKKTAPDNTKYSEILNLYQTGMCNCLTAKFTSPDKWASSNKILNKCEDSLAKDKKYWSRFTELTKPLSKPEREKLSKLMDKYIFLRCAAYRNTAHDFMYEKLLNFYDDAVGAVGEYMFTEPIYYYSNKKMDSLAWFFPTYKKYEQDLKSACAMDTMSYMVSEGPIPYAEKEGSKVVTFYTIIPGGAKIQGQLAITYTRTKPFKVISYTFIPPAKIKDMANLNAKAVSHTMDQIFRFDDDEGF